MKRLDIAMLILLGLVVVSDLPLFPFVYQIISFFINLVFLTLIIYIAGLVVVGKDRAKLSAALTIASLGSFLDLVLNLFFTLVPKSSNWYWEYTLSVFRALLIFVFWLSLIKNFYETGWLRAFAVAVLALIIVEVLELFLIPSFIALIV